MLYGGRVRVRMAMACLYSSMPVYFQMILELVSKRGSFGFGCFANLEGTSRYKLFGHWVLETRARWRVVARVLDQGQDVLSC